MYISITAIGESGSLFAYELCRKYWFMMLFLWTTNFDYSRFWSATNLQFSLIYVLWMWMSNLATIQLTHRNIWNLPTHLCLSDHGNLIWLWFSFLFCDILREGIISTMAERWISQDIASIWKWQWFVFCRIATRQTALNQESDWTRILIEYWP